MFDIINQMRIITRCNHFEDRDKNDLYQLLNSFEEGLMNPEAKHAVLFELALCENGNKDWGFVININQGLSKC